jgi:hypothetical protein
MGESPRRPAWALRDWLLRICTGGSVFGEPGAASQKMRRPWLTSDEPWPSVSAARNQKGLL